MKTFRNILIGLALSAGLLAGGAPTFAQTYPTTSPTYIPDAVLAPKTLTAPGDYYFVVNGANTVTFNVAGTCTALSADVQGSVNRSTSAVFTHLRIHKRGAQPVPLITATGTYSVAPPAYGYVRVHVTALSASCTLLADGSIALMYVDTNPEPRTTYSAAVTGLVAASSASDVFGISGLVGHTIRITRICVSGRATAAASEDVLLIKRSTADTGGTPGTTPVAVPNSSASVASNATLVDYTANPTTGTGVGNVGAKQMFLGNLTTAAPGSAACWDWSAGSRLEQELILTTAAEQLVVNLNGVTNSGNVHNIEVSWTEE